MKKYKIVAAIIVSVIFAAIFFQCSGVGVSATKQTVETKAGTVDLSPMPANSEFLDE